MLRYVLDAWPVLEWIKGREPTSSRLRDLVADMAKHHGSIHMSRINHGEVIYMVHKSPDIRDSQAVLRAFSSLPIALHSVDDALVSEAVKLKTVYATSYADVFAATLSIRLHAPFITGDREFRALEVDCLLRLPWLGA